MKDTQKANGRPAKLAGKRIKKIDARFTEDEYAVVLELEKALGIRKTDLVRNRLLQDAPLTVINAKDLMASLDGIGAELGRCGNNINQLARYANILKKKGLASPLILERFDLLFSQYLDNQTLLDASLRKILRLLNHG